MSSGIKLVLALVIAAGAVAIPLVLKSGDPSDKDVGGPHASGETVEAAPASRCGDSARTSPDGACLPATTPSSAPPPPPRFVDLGTTTCAPCRVMLGVMEELERRYPQAALRVEFVNVQKDKGGLERYGVTVIPTQIFYSPEGRELFRHKGVMHADAVVAQWKALGFDLDASGEKE